MAKIDLSLRERHAIKWHLNTIQFPTHAERKKLDSVWEALKLDNFSTKQNQDPDTIDVAPVSYELSSTQRDYLIEWLNAPMLGIMGRLISAAEARLIKSRDGGE
jgi:hypothetical protein